MAVHIQSQRWTRQPPRGTLLDRDHTLLRGQCTHAFSWGHEQNLITGARPTITGAWAVEPGPGGVGFDAWDGGSLADHYSPVTYINNTSPWTVAFIIVPTSSTAAGGIFIHGNGRLSGDGCNAGYFNTSGRYGGWVYSGGAITLDSPNNVVKGGVAQVVVFSVAPYDYRLYVDGTLQDSDSSGSSTGRTFSTFNAGSGYSAPDSGLQASIPLMLRMNRAWSASEVEQFTRNPWDVFHPSRKFFFAAAAATGGSFNAAWAGGSNVVIQPGAMQ